MKIGVVTFYDAFNYGAYWQAKALEDFLRECIGSEVYFLKTSQRRFVKEYLKKLDNLRRLKVISMESAWFYLRLYIAFLKIRKNFKIVSLKKANLIDLFVFGSDEIWNINRKINSRKSAGILWGKGLPDNIPRMSYAPSVNEATKEMFTKRLDLLSEVKKFKAVSGRDINTCAILSEVLERDFQLVVDPTLLHTDRYYIKQQVLPEQKDYILIYSYGLSFTEQDVMQIKEFAKKTGKRLISFGNYLEFADENIYGTVNEFLGYFDKASFVITDTFHGTMFSIIYKKPVALIVHKEGKLRAAIKQYGLEMMECTGQLNEERLNLDYEKLWEQVYVNVEKHRESSIEYILTQLEQINKV